MRQGRSHVRHLPQGQSSTVAGNPIASSGLQWQCFGGSLNTDLAGGKVDLDLKFKGFAEAFSQSLSATSPPPQNATVLS